MENKVHLRFPARPEYIQPLRALAEKLLHVWIPEGAESPEAFEILLALQEAVTNVIRHAYQNRGGVIEAEIRYRDGEVEFELRDWGLPFDPAKVPLPNFDCPSPGGYGVFIIKKVTDRMEFRRDGDMNISQLMKRLPGAPKTPAPPDATSAETKP